MSAIDEELEPIDDFRARLRAWLPDNLPRQGEKVYEESDDEDEAELQDVQLNRDIQRKLFDGGFAGLIFPKEYGGQGLTPAYQQVLNEEISGYQYPWRIQVPTFTPCATVIMDFGTEEQKRNHLPAIFRGDELWMQMLSEPSGGSDVAGAQTSAVRDGEQWILNGSKIWTTGAWWSDWALCLARTNWDVQKHRGLSVFMLRLHDQPGMEVHRIEMLNGTKEFCQEFLTDVIVPDSDRVGEVDDGWTVGTRWMMYEKSFGISMYTTRPSGGQGMGMMGPGRAFSSAIATARRTGRIDDAATRERIGEAHGLGLAAAEGTGRIASAMATGKYSDRAAGLVRILGNSMRDRTSAAAFEMAGSSLAAWEPGDEDFGVQANGFLSRQAGSLAGGSIEMARNVVSERFLGMPRERTLDRDVAFRDVPRGPSAG